MFNYERVLIMSDNGFEKTQLVTAALLRNNLKFNVRHLDNFDSVDLKFSLESGPFVTLQYLCDENVSVYIFDIITGIPEEKLDRVMRTCNICNCNYKFFKFYVTDDRALNMSFNYPGYTSADSVGDISLEMFLRAKSILNETYGSFMKALYTDEPIEF